jgi:nickel superoxide dismutase
MKKMFTVLALASSIFLATPSTYGHCEIPCGIYDDHARVESMLEDAETIHKSMNEIVKLSSKKDALSQNQLVRWITNKEAHAQKIIDTISNYFLTQRVKSDQKDYMLRLVKHHRVIVLAMKAKQNVDVKFYKELKESIEALAAYYPEHKH